VFGNAAVRQRRGPIGPATKGQFRPWRIAEAKRECACCSRFTMMRREAWKSIDALAR
jgi:hypothetical protein